MACVVMPLKSQSPLIGAVFLTHRRNVRKDQRDYVSIPSNRGSVSDLELYCIQSIHFL
ncbi:hypothetical protein MTBBW1_3320002 [Desulfamplus magnetovallimortis]|uniref:Uncharacterized protein n=1 Tax=Desulfamplus magnetovallimortis TaxID=1246637 RepID=A0A1W1HGC9_9BACT|nr:hypothetical protein MTBBW1_3320002 [Desulfamplus magnetovallimortis]